MRYLLFFENRLVGSAKVFCEIRKLNDDLVSLEVKIIRKLENLSDSPQTLVLSLGVDDWQIPGHPSEIIELTYQIEGQQKHTVPISEVSDRKMGLVLAGPTIEVPGLKWVEVRQHYKETKRHFDEHSIGFSTAAKDPKITITIPEGFGWRPGFPHRRAPVRDDFVNTVQLNGTLLPHQTIAIQWWDEGGLTTNHAASAKP
jgi:hypothetical protein